MGILKICGRTLRDWRDEKFTMSYDAVRVLCSQARCDIPADITLLPGYWNVKRAGRLGAIERYKKFGNPGTEQGRQRGGLKTIARFQADPELARMLGFKIKKTIICPYFSESLAEFIGILLGDGTINDYQVRIFVDSRKDMEYARFIQGLTKELFDLYASFNYERKNTLRAHHVTVPAWIWSNIEYMKACLRGLMDTDGGVYFHSHVTKGIAYKHIALCFTSHALLLLTSVHRIVSEMGINSKIDFKRRVGVYRRSEIDKYMQSIGSHNSRLIERYQSYKN